MVQFKILRYGSSSDRYDIRIQIRVPTLLSLPRIRIKDATLILLLGSGSEIQTLFKPRDPDQRDPKLIRPLRSGSGIITSRVVDPD
jgi:hypothetical protein